MKKTCVLIPSYNEEKAIGPIVKAISQRGLVVYVVDDGSSDRTDKIAKENGAIVIRNEKNSGKGASMRIGFERALKDGYDAVMVMDGDGQHDVSDIDNFIRKMDESGADFITGNRMLDTQAMPMVRKCTNQFMSWLLSRMAGFNIPDTQCGFKLINRSVLEKINVESSNYDVESELLIKAARSGFKIESVTIKTIYGNEKSRINPFVDTLKFIGLVFKATFIWRRNG